MARVFGSIMALAVAAIAFLAAPAAMAACASPDEALSESGFVSIGGIEQWVTIRGARCGNPVILFLHGGPGNPLNPYSEVIYGPWENDFTLVQWDQRGAGMTYGRNRPSEEEPLSLEQMTADGLDVARHVIQRLGADKVILMGGSWGSVLGVRMVKAEPELFHAYIGTSQLVSSLENTADTYARVLGLAREAGDQDVVASMEILGPPPWTNPRNVGILRRAVRKYESRSTDPFPDGWWDFAEPYATPEAMADYEAGEEYSFIQYVGFNGDGMVSQVDLRALGTTFEVPVILVQGHEDLLTSEAVTRRYFDEITAPQKDLIIVPRAGHDPNRPIVDAQWEALTRLVLPRL